MQSKCFVCERPSFEFEQKAVVRKRSRSQRPPQHIVGLPRPVTVKLTLKPPPLTLKKLEIRVRFMTRGGRRRRSKEEEEEEGGGGRKKERRRKGGGRGSSHEPDPDLQFFLGVRGDGFKVKRSGRANEY